MVVPTLDSFRRMGVRIGVDDFGTGYSSLASLRRLPLDVLKIDPSFVLGVTTSTADAVVARTVVRLAEALELATVAEGIETTEQARALSEMGAGYGQGYLFGRPQPADTIEDVLRATVTPVSEGAPP
ncbi:MAG: EAL domain-containing protein [Actinomycetota bacterium]